MQKHEDGLIIIHDIFSWISNSYKRAGKEPQRVYLQIDKFINIHIVKNRFPSTKIKKYREKNCETVIAIRNP